MFSLFRDKIRVLAHGVHMNGFVVVPVYVCMHTISCVL